MKTSRILPLFAIVVLLSAAPAVWAAWSTPLSMGTTTVLSDPSCASPVPGTAVCAARGLGQILVVNHFNGTTWSGWTSIAGVVTSNPSCAANGAGEVLCAARNNSGGISGTLFNGSTWSALVKAGGQITSGPSCAELTAGNVLCVGRSTAGGFTSSIFNGTTWSAFKTLNGSTVSEPGCGSDNAGNVICIATTTSTWSIVAARFSGAAWSGFINIAGKSTSDRYSCTALGGTFGVLSCFARGSDESVNVNDFKGGAWTVANWSGWSSLAGAANPGTSCSQLSTGELGCATVASDSALWVNSFNGSSWSGWLSLGGQHISNPACAGLGTGKVVCAVVGLNGKATSTVGP
jgi:hypothetical protein